MQKVTSPHAKTDHFGGCLGQFLHVAKNKQALCLQLDAAKTVSDFLCWFAYIRRNQRKVLGRDTVLFESVEERRHREREKE